MSTANERRTPIDMVNDPPHYTRDGAMECIDEMIMVFGKEKVKAFCLCNAWKYRYRAGSKNAWAEDMKKSDWYLQKYKELDETGYTISTCNPYNIVPCSTESDPTKITVSY